MCVCVRVCACVRACVCACVRMYMRIYIYISMCVLACVCMYMYNARAALPKSAGVVADRWRRVCEIWMGALLILSQSTRHHWHGWRPYSHTQTACHKFDAQQHRDQKQRFHSHHSTTYWARNQRKKEKKTRPKPLPLALQLSLKTRFTLQIVRTVGFGEGWGGLWGGGYPVYSSRGGVVPRLFK